MGSMKEIGDLLIASVKSYVGAALSSISTRMDGFDAALKAIPAGPPGPQGIPGESIKGEAGEKGADVDPIIIRSVVEAEVDRAVARLPVPQNGKDGATGERGIAGERGEPGPQGERGEPGPAGGKGEPGPQGAAGDAGIPGPAGAPGAPGDRGEQGIAGETGKPGADGKDGTPGRDGKDADPEFVRAEVARAVAAIPAAKDGTPGKDAIAVEILPGIDESKSYPRGTYAEYRGGEIRAIRNTDPITDGLEKAGWVVSRNGIADESEETLDEGRTIRRTTVYTSGRKFVRESKTAAIIYRQVWREGEYLPGDIVTWSGSTWHCQEQTTDKPGISAAWKLMVKRGNDGKDGKDAGAGTAPREPVKLR
jgi:integrin beta 3